MSNTVYVFQCGCQYDRTNMMFRSKKPVCKMHGTPVSHIIVTCEYCGVLHQVEKGSSHTKLCPDCKKISQYDRTARSARTRHFVCGCAYNASEIKSKRHGLRDCRCPVHKAALSHNSTRCKTCLKTFVVPKSQRGFTVYCPDCHPDKTQAQRQRKMYANARLKRKEQEEKQIQAAIDRSDCQHRLTVCLPKNRHDAKSAGLPCLGCHRYTPPADGMIPYGEIYAYKHGFEISDLATEGI